MGCSRFNFCLGERVSFALEQWSDAARLRAVLKDIFGRYSQARGDTQAN